MIAAVRARGIRARDWKPTMPWIMLMSPARLQVVNGMFSTTTGRIDDRWRRFMQFQIKRTRYIFASAEAGVDQLAPDARLPVW